VETQPTAHVDLYWLPLGAGTVVVRWSGRVYEAIVARRQHRAAGALFHAALRVRLGDEQHVIEMAPVWGHGSGDRGVVGEGPVGARRLGRSPLFRYEVRRWRDGVIPDLVYAVAGPRRLSTDPGRARALLDLVPRFPNVTWGRDELAAGEMWNSNSLVAWLLARSGHDVRQIQPPDGGRAPGWSAGLVVAARDLRVGGARLCDFRPCRTTLPARHRWR
jgi:hypothetical protein